MLIVAALVLVPVLVVCIGNNFTNKLANAFLWLRPKSSRNPTNPPSPLPSLPMFSAASMMPSLRSRTTRLTAEGLVAGPDHAVPLAEAAEAVRTVPHSPVARLGRVEPIRQAPRVVARVGSDPGLTPV